MAAVETATRRAIEVPLRIMEAAVESFTVLAAMAEHGLESSVSDAGVGSLLARAAVRGAGLNVQINTASLSREAATPFLERAAVLDTEAAERESAIVAMALNRIGEAQ